jgi:hypothetical protein
MLHAYRRGNLVGIAREEVEGQVVEMRELANEFQYLVDTTQDTR